MIACLLRVCEYLCLCVSVYVSVEVEVGGEESMQTWSWRSETRVTLSLISDSLASRAPLNAMASACASVSSSVSLARALTRFAWG